MPVFLAIKEISYSKGRFLLIALIVALITTLVLFIAALAEGLGSGNREYIQKLNGELIAIQEKVDLSVAASQIGRSKMSEIRRIKGVSDVGQVGFAAGTIIFADGRKSLDIALVGVEPGHPGEPEVQTGRPLGRDRSSEAIVDANVVTQGKVKLGDTITIKVIQGTDEELYDLKVIGISDGRKYQLRPGSIFVPYLEWDKIRPQATQNIGQGELVSNIIAIKLDDPSDWKNIANTIQANVSKIQVVDRKTAYEAFPGYSQQQSTLDTQRYFTFFISVLVIGGFFQIQTLQKVAQVGMLKAVGASNFTVVIASLTQIITINALGVLFGTLGTLALARAIPPNVPVVFVGQSVLTAIVSLLMIGPVGGLVSVWVLLKVEPLTALGLAQ
ncbi:MAG: ABC transporter permease [Chloroflexi bacterium]|nr:ABC transporter permease [Chloroflexota bacterium]